jgi:hypothetical protein
VVDDDALGSRLETAYVRTMKVLALTMHVGRVRDGLV